MKRWDFSAGQLLGGTHDFSDDAGQVVMIVNVASKCGLTPQYSGLETLWQTYRDRGLRIYGFPCNQFGAQEPGSADDIAQFCESMYSVSFPLMAKIDVNGPTADPIYRWLKSEAPNADGSADVLWNFNKFLVARDGASVVRVAPNVEPASMAPEIERLLD